MNYQFLLIYSDHLKKTFYLCSLVFLFSTYSCMRPVSVEPPCTDKATMSIDVPVRYLGSCSAFFETATQPMKVQITVDGFSVNSDSIKTTVMDAFSFNTDNNTTGINIRTFSIKVPKCGSYFITLNIRGKDNSCFKCCSGNPALQLANQCVFPNKGIVNFRAISFKINSTATTPPPSTLDLIPEILNCVDCGC